MNSLKISNRLVSVGIITAGLIALSLPFVASAETLYRQLQLGMSGGDVSTLQIFLAKDATIYPQGLVTGYFGFLTKSAVSNFQSRNGLETVGRVGPLTMALINSQMNGDTTSPWISAVSVSLSNTQASLAWNTNENAAAVVYYSSSPLSATEGSPTSAVTVGGTSLLVHTDLRSTHSATITGLSPNTTYYYVVYVRDGSGNESMTWPATFHTSN